MWKFLFILLSICPVIAIIILGLGSLMPDCTVGSRGYLFSNCYLLGLNLNWLMGIGFLVLIGTMWTMALMPWLMAGIVVAKVLYWILAKILRCLFGESNTEVQCEIKFKHPVSTQRKVLDK